MQLESNYMGGLAATGEAKLSDDSPKMKKWHSMSWTGRVASQEVHYTDQMALQRACDTLHSLPPLITRKEIDDSLQLVREAANGKAFLLQGGDCAESFADVKADLIDGKVSLLREQAAKLGAGLQVPVVQFGRIAGHASCRATCTPL
ncbi:hypothetical protein NLG97_g5442 [Lecanicillium saksenae]|uniref:Uncharacterized protein n=1 Tax=Lecanicillium saksenae TaxID=468837 RepID=A0ACC1QVM1_9HYPO|nr:hypothetical protein NLG97_g5442 [Lecanicillium saksenae]